MYEANAAALKHMPRYIAHHILHQLNFVFSVCACVRAHMYIHTCIFGVPQSSVLGSVKFLICTNDIEESVSNKT